MPLVEIKLIEGEIPEARSQELIEKVTDAVASCAGENLRRYIWVLV
jgi:phenylpyruvate tautomerase PptA (4-oxalocrotonate tautomerase family)